jgi:signal transduction histidine kinase
LESRDHFIAALSEALRNVVAPVMLLVDQFEALEQRFEDEKLSSRITLLTKSLQKFVATVDRVTEVAQLRGGALELDITAVDLVDVVTEVVARTRLHAEGVEVVVEALEPVVGWWDRRRLDQIVNGLVTNAIRHTDTGVVEIAVHKHARHAELIVRDHRSTLLPEPLENRLDSSNRTSGEYGVGLFVVQVLSEALGGEARGENMPDGGACFRVLLPCG